MKHICESCENGVSINDKFCPSCGSMFDAKGQDPDKQRFKSFQKKVKSGEKKLIAELKKGIDTGVVIGDLLGLAALNLGKNKWVTGGESSGDPESGLMTTREVIKEFKEFFKELLSGDNFGGPEIENGKIYEGEDESFNEWFSIGESSRDWPPYVYEL